MRLTINSSWCRAVWGITPLSRWSDAHPASGLRPGDSLVFVWPQPWGSEPHRMSLKHYGIPEGPGRLEPWAVASLLGEAQDAIAERLSGLDTLYNYQTGEAIRLASRVEAAQSLEAAEHDNGAGVIRVEGKSCYVL